MSCIMAEKKKPKNKKQERSSRNNNRDDPPVIFYDKSTPRPRQAPLAEPIEETEMTVTSTSESHSGFMIEFSDSSSPKMARKERNLRDMVPRSLRAKMETSARLAEEKRASRMSRSKSQEFLKSPRESPTSFKRMQDLWAQAKNSAKSPTDSEPNGCADFEERSSLNGSHEKVKDHACKPKRRSQPSPAVMVEDQESGEEGGGDNVSETGTYTIDSDVPSKDLIEARANIDEVFGVGQGTGSDADTDKDVSDEEMMEEVVESKDKKENDPGSKDIWVEEWANNTSQRSNGTSTEGCNNTEDKVESSRRSAKPPRGKQSSPAKKNGNHAPESPSRGQRSRRLLPAVPSLRRRKPNGCLSPPHSPEPKSEPFMRTSQSAFSFPTDNGLSVDNTNARNISKSSTKLSMADTDDTEILLKDTETLMHHLEERMKKSRLSSEEDNAPFSKVEVTDEENSEVFDTVSNSEQSSVGPSAASNSLYSKKGRASPSPKTSTRWSRLSTPNKHKVATEQEEGPKTKGPQRKPQAKSAESKSSNFQRNTHRTSSLPNDHEKMKKSKKESSTASSKLKQASGAQKSSAPSKSKQSVVLPRQTRSTLLRNSRFAGSSGNIADVSPASSISDLSSSKASLNPWRKKSLPNIGLYQDNKFSCSDSDVGLYSTRKQRGGSTAKVETKPGAKKAPAKRDRSRSMGESSLKSTPQNTHKKASTAPSTKNSKPSVKSPSTIEAYINSVRGRRTEKATAPPKKREGQRTSARKQIQSQESPVQPEDDQPKALEIEESQDLVNDLEDLSKEENTVDEILGQDKFSTPSIVYTRPSRGIKADRQKKLEFRLKRCSSLDLGDEYPKDLPFERKSLLKRHGPGDMYQGKSESFDDLVLSSINHLSKKLRDSSDQLLTKINPSSTPAIPHPEMDRDYPFLKTENREIAHILHNLRKMERKLEEIHSFVDKGESKSSPSTKRIPPSRRWNKPPDIIQSEETMI